MQITNRPVAVAVAATVVVVHYQTTW